MSGSFEAKGGGATAVPLSGGRIRNVYIQKKNWDVGAAKATAVVANDDLLQGRRLHVLTVTALGSVILFSPEVYRNTKLIQVYPMEIKRSYCILVVVTQAQYLACSQEEGINVSFRK